MERCWSCACFAVCMFRCLHVSLSSCVVVCRFSPATRLDRDDIDTDTKRLEGGWKQQFVPWKLLLFGTVSHICGRPAHPCRICMYMARRVAEHGPARSNVRFVNRQTQTLRPTAGAPHLLQPAPFARGGRRAYVCVYACMYVAIDLGTECEHRPSASQSASRPASCAHCHKCHGRPSGAPGRR